MLMLTAKYSWYIIAITNDKIYQMIFFIKENGEVYE